MKSVIGLIIVLFVTATICKAKENFILDNNTSINAPAPTGTSNRIFGRLYDGNFNEIHNIPKINGKVISIPEKIDHFYYSEISNTSQLKAGAEVFNILKADISKLQSQRFAILNVYHVEKTEVFEIDSLPEGDYLYPKKILYGWSIHYLIYGSQESFTSDVSGSLNKMIKLGGNINYFLGKNSLLEESVRRGLVSKNNDEVPIVSRPANVANYYKPANPEPIFIEYQAKGNIEKRKIEWYSGNEQYIIENISFTISKKKINNKKWDTFGGIDPCVIINGKKTLGVPKKFNQTLILNYDFSAKDLPIEIKIVDEDKTKDDEIGIIKLREEDIKRLKNGMPIILKNPNRQLSRIMMKIRKQK